MLLSNFCRPFHGLNEFSYLLPRVSLRSTLGFMLPPAIAGWLCQHHRARDHHHTSTTSVNKETINPISTDLGR